MSTEYFTLSSTPGDLDTLIQSIDFENQQYVKLIELENTQIEGLETNIALKQQTSIELNKDTCKLDEDTKQAHHQFTINRDNCVSLKKTAKVLDDHKVVLIKRLEELKIEGEKNKTERAAIVSHYEQIWEDYKQKYESFPLAKELQGKHKVLHSLSEMIDSCKERIDTLKDNIKKAKGLEDVDIFNLNEFIVKLVEQKMSNDKKKAEMEEDKNRIDQLTDNIASLKLQKQNIEKEIQQKQMAIETENNRDCQNLDNQENVCNEPQLESLTRDNILSRTADDLINNSENNRKDDVTLEENLNSNQTYQHPTMNQQNQENVNNMPNDDRFINQESEDDTRPTTNNDLGQMQENGKQTGDGHASMLVSPAYNTDQSLFRNQPQILQTQSRMQSQSQSRNQSQDQSQLPQRRFVSVPSRRGDYQNQPILVREQQERSAGQIRGYGDMTNAQNLGTWQHEQINQSQSDIQGETIQRDRCQIRGQIQGQIQKSQGQIHGQVNSSETQSRFQRCQIQFPQRRLIQCQIPVERVSNMGQVRQGVVSSQRNVQEQPQLCQGVVSSQTNGQEQPQLRQGVVSSQRNVQEQPQVRQGVVSSQRNVQEQPQVRQGVISSQRNVQEHPQVRQGVVSSQRIPREQPQLRQGVVSIRRNAQEQPPLRQGVVSCHRDAQEQPPPLQGVVSSQRNSHEQSSGHLQIRGHYMIPQRQRAQIVAQAGPDFVAQGAVCQPLDNIESSRGQGQVQTGQGSRAQVANYAVSQPVQNHDGPSQGQGQFTGRGQIIRPDQNRGGQSQVGQGRIDQGSWGQGQHIQEPTHDDGHINREFDDFGKIIMSYSDQEQMTKQVQAMNIDKGQIISHNREPSQNACQSFSITEGQTSNVVQETMNRPTDGDKQRKILIQGQSGINNNGQKIQRGQVQVNYSPRYQAPTNISYSPLINRKVNQETIDTRKNVSETTNITQNESINNAQMEQSCGGLRQQGQVTRDGELNIDKRTQAWVMQHDTSVTATVGAAGGAEDDAYMTAQEDKSVCDNQTPTRPEKLENNPKTPVSEFTMERHKERLKQLNKSPAPPEMIQRPMFSMKFGDSNNDYLDKDSGSNSNWMSSFFNPMAVKSPTGHNSPSMKNNDVMNFGMSSSLDFTSNQDTGMSFNLGGRDTDAPKSPMFSMFGDAPDDNDDNGGGFSFSFGSNDVKSPTSAFSLF